MTVEYDKKLGFLAAFGKDFQILMKIRWQKRRGWKKLPRFIKTIYDTKLRSLKSKLAYFIISKISNLFSICSIEIKNVFPEFIENRISEGIQSLPRIPFPSVSFSSRIHLKIFDDKIYLTSYEKSSKI